MNKGILRHLGLTVAMAALLAAPMVSLAQSGVIGTDPDPGNQPAAMMVPLVVSLATL